MACTTKHLHVTSQTKKDSKNYSMHQINFPVSRIDRSEHLSVPLLFRSSLHPSNVPIRVFVS